MRSWQLPDSQRTYMVFGPFGFVMYLKASPNELDAARAECSFFVDHSTRVVDIL